MKVLAAVVAVSLSFPFHASAQAVQRTNGPVRSEKLNSPRANAPTPKAAPKKEAVPAEAKPADAIPAVAAPAEPEKKTDAQYWTETGLTTAHLVEPLLIATNENCTYDINAFKGCMAAFNAVLQYHSPMLVLIPESVASDAIYAKSKVILNLSPFVLVEYPKSEEKLTTYGYYQRYDAIRKLNDDAFVKLMDSGALKAVDFTGLYNKVLTYGVTDPSQDALVASTAINVFLITALDAHAHIDAYQQQRDTSSDNSSHFFGVGANILDREGRVAVQDIIPGGGAEKGGLLPNDIFVSIAEKSAVSLTSEEVKNLLRGEAGTTVAVVVSRQGKEVTLALTRGKVTLSNVAPKMRNSFGKKVGYIRLGSFVDDNACTNMEKAVRKLEADEATGLVLDLRGNGGGSIQQAVCIGGLFVGKKVIVIQKNLKTGESVPLAAASDAITNLPMSILIDANSASASEILSGALQDYGRAWIIGDRSFGKASVQQGRPGFAGNFNIMLFSTIARFYQPSGRTNERVGIIPDLSFPALPGKTKEELFVPREADLYPNALTAEGPAWNQPRVGTAIKLADCVMNGDVSLDSFYKAILDTPYVADYQYIAAEKALHCNIR